MQSVYDDNPKILGVVRAAVDLAWRNKRADEAIGILTASAGRANATYCWQFLVEAARKANEAGQYAKAREIIDPLLAAEPRPPILSRSGGFPYARAGQDEALRTFYAAKLQAIRIRRRGRRCAVLSYRCSRG